MNRSVGLSGHPRVDTLNPKHILPPPVGTIGTLRHLDIPIIVLGGDDARTYAETLAGQVLALPRGSGPEFPKRGTALQRASEVLARERSWLTPDERETVDGTGEGMVLYGPLSAIPRVGMAASHAGGSAGGFISRVGRGLAVVEGAPGESACVPLAALLLPVRGSVGDAGVFGYDAALVNVGGAA